MKNYRWGIIGPGKIAHKFAVALTLAGGAQLDAIASRDGSRARAFAEKYNVPRYYDSYEALVKDPDIDAVYVSTPHAFHCDQTILALTHGKPVLCEKPMALTQREVGKMVEAARDNNVFLMEAMWTRFLPMTRAILELVSSGQIGEIKYIRADFGFYAAFDPAGRLFDIRLGGGSLLDIGIYPLYLCLQLLGEPAKIVAAGRLSPTGSDETCHAILEYPNGANAIISSTLSCQTPLTAEIAGTKGMIRIPTPWYKNDHFEWNRNGEPAQTVQLEPMVNGFEYQIREVQQCIARGMTESPSLPHSFSLMMARTMDTIRGQIGVRYLTDPA